MAEYQEGLSDLEKTYNYDRVILEQIYTLFLQKVPQALEELKKLNDQLSRESLERVITLVHLISNNAAVMRQHELAEESQRAEANARSGNVEATKSGIERIIPIAEGLVETVTRKR